jgi:hypothetical protein
VTNDGGRDIVFDWQARPSSDPPKLTVYPAKLVRGKGVRLRYSVRDVNPYVSVSFAIVYRYRNGGGEASTSSASPRTRADGSIQTISFDADFLDEILSRTLTSARFCVAAVDPYFNGPAQSCAKLTVPRKKR